MEHKFGRQKTGGVQVDPLDMARFAKRALEKRSKSKSKTKDGKEAEIAINVAEDQEERYSQTAKVESKDRKGNEEPGLTLRGRRRREKKSSRTRMYGHLLYTQHRDCQRHE